MKVIVGMSGGVDSAVAAFLLCKEGYEVEGLYMKNWDSSLNNDLEGISSTICSQEQDYLDAKKVCDMLHIKLHRVEFIKEYYEDVFSYFLYELKKGRTPNPDIMCNKYIKFDRFIEYAKKLGAEKIATGHYAKLIDDKLYKAYDTKKDQTYFLSLVPKGKFKNCLFPLGNLTKDNVREIAKNNNIPVFDKKDSTGICFIGERNFQKFIQNYIKKNKGDIINIETGKIIGTHDGLMNYTIGQRRNVGISGFHERHFVVGKDTSKNILYVAFNNAESYLTSTSSLCEDFNYIGDKRPLECSAKFRYRQKDIPVKVKYMSNNEVLVSYDSVQGVTPGQACVLYYNDECIGGGITKEIYMNNIKISYL
ncbi:MAG: tRNA 2-thiouridine(34) synthase MnmA [Bacilli bacterium]